MKPFANSQVTLGESLFPANRDRVLNFLNAYPADRMLAIFRRNAGLDDKGAQPPGGWETADGNLRGHYAGTFSAPWRWPTRRLRRQAYKDKLDYMVTALGQCQDALAATVGQPALRLARRQGEREVRPGGELRTGPSTCHCPPAS